MGSLNVLFEFQGLSKGGKKGAKKKIVDPFTKKDWYDIKAPSIFKVRDVGKTLVNRTQGTRIASDGLKGRVYEVSLADLQNEHDAERSFRKFKLICEDVQGKNCLTNFYGMNLTTDKLRSMVKKWQTLIEAHADVKTTDGYLLRVFCIGFTHKQQYQNSKTCYAQAQQVRKGKAKKGNLGLEGVWKIRCTLVMTSLIHSLRLGIIFRV